MTTALRFRTVEEYSSRGGSLMRPYLAVRLNYAGAYLNTFGLVDSGADRSLFHVEHALQLGLALNPPMAQQVGGVGGTSQAWSFDIYLSAGGKRFPARVAFSAGCPREYGLLGRGDYFRAFGVAFQETRSRFLLQPNR